MKTDIEKLGLRELDSLLAAAEQRKKQLSGRRPPAVVRRRLIAFAASQGYTIEELVGVQPAVASPRGGAGKRKRPKVAAKYRDPENKRNTWSGRGRMPRWLAARTKRGQSAADFLIPGLGQPTAKNSGSIGRKSVFKRAPGAST